MRRLTNLGISGIADPSDASLPSNKWSAGAGIRVQKADTIRMENLDIRCAQAQGVYLEKLTLIAQ